MLSKLLVHINLYNFRCFALNVSSLSGIASRSICVGLIASWASCVLFSTADSDFSFLDFDFVDFDFDLAEFAVLVSSSS